MVKKKNPVTRVLIYVLLIGLTVITLTPLIWMISSSLKIDSEVFTVPIKWIPDDPQWSNYTKVWEKIPLLTFTWNSIKLTADRAHHDHTGDHVKLRGLWFREM